MNDFFFDDTYPDYAYQDKDYQHCKNLDEVKVLRLIKTYSDFVHQRYNQQVQFVYDTFKPNDKGKSLRTTPLFKNLKEYILPGIEGRDPAHFIAFVFESWGRRKHHAAYAKHDAGSGYMYPSWNHIIKNYEALVEQFKNNPAYKPKDFIPKDDFVANYKDAVENRMRRWCVTHDKTPRDYWLTAKHLFPPFLSSKEFPYACSHPGGLREYAKEIEEKFEFTLDELKEFIVELEELEKQEFDKAYQKNTIRQKAGLPMAFNNIKTLDD